MKKTLLIIASIMVLAALFYSYVSSPSPLLLTNAKIYRAGGISDSATALLVEEGRISFIGNDREAASLAPGGAEIIDLQGKLVLPGFIDSHVHPLFGAMMDAACPLQAVENAEDLRQALNKCQSEQPRELLIYRTLARSDEGTRRECLDRLRLLSFGDDDEGCRIPRKASGRRAASDRCDRFGTSVCCSEA